MQTGFISRWKPDKQYGFIRPVDHQQVAFDIFFHRKAIINNQDGRAIDAGARVEFEVAPDGDRWQAVNVLVLAGPERAPCPQQPQGTTTGVICKWFPERAFGFIRRDGQRDLFFHRHGVAAKSDEEITVGRAVSYEVIPDTGDREKAINIRFLDEQV